MHIKHSTLAAALAAFAAVTGTAQASAAPPAVKLQGALGQIADGAAGGVLFVRHGTASRVYTSGVANRQPGGPPRTIPMHPTPVGLGRCGRVRFRWCPQRDSRVP